MTAGCMITGAIVVAIGLTAVAIGRGIIFGVARSYGARLHTNDSK